LPPLKVCGNCGMGCTTAADTDLLHLQISVTDKAEGARPLSGGFILQVTLLFAEALPIGRPGVCMDSPLETSHEFAQYSALRLFLRNPETVLLPKMTSMSAYELERLENIRQNNLRLQELGLDAPPPSRAGASVRAPPKRKRPALSTAFPEELVERRRSLRQRVATVIYSDETPLPQTHSRAQPVERSRPYEAPEDDNQEDGAARESTAMLTEVAERPPPDAGSARAIALSVDAIIERHLGKPVSSTFTKAAAVEAITGRKNVSFSKYAGSLEWRNAILLWVNIGGADYRNVFLDGGARMTWYASPKNNEGTPVVRRLLAGKEAVLLFCRLQQEGSSEPYVCCGRLEYVSHDPSRQPLKFVWSLRDLETLRKSADFRELLAAAD